MIFAPLLVSAAESGIAGVNHWFVGAGVLVIFIVLMAGLLAFGGGRDHS